MAILIKPEIGAAPFYIRAEERIQELAEAISRASSKDNIDNIRLWTHEILKQCDLIEEMNDEII